MLSDQKRRAKVLATMSRFDFLDPKWIVATELHSTELHTRAEIVRALRLAGAPDECHIISEDSTIDGRDLPLGEAVDAAESFDFCSVLCGLPGRVAFAFGEAYAPRIRVLLRRPPE